MAIIGNIISSRAFRMIEGLIRLFQQLVIIFQVTFKQFSCVKTADPDTDRNCDWGCISCDFADLAPQPICHRTDNLIPNKMPMGVIYGFEVINIYH